MPSTLQVLSALVAGAATARAANGPYFSTGPTSSSTYIKESTATLVLPAAPANNQGDLSLWVGMGTSAGDLIQSIADCYVRPPRARFCSSLFSSCGPRRTPEHLADL